MTRAPARQLVQLTPDGFAARLDEALQIYVAAMGYPQATARHRRALWLDHTRRPGWLAVGWLDAGGGLLGLAYGYAGGPGQWWHEEVRRGVIGRRVAAGDTPPAATATATAAATTTADTTAGETAACDTGFGWLGDYFELTELHVHPDAQGGGLGEGLLRALLALTDRPAVLLSTPEHGPHAPGRAWRLYRRTRFRDVLREHRFTGDVRPFAVLGRSLPLEPPTTADGRPDSTG